MSDDEEESEQITEQQYLEMAEDAKQRIQDKNKIIENQEVRIENLTSTCEAYRNKVENMKATLAFLINCVD